MGNFQSGIEAGLEFRRHSDKKITSVDQAPLEMGLDPVLDALAQDTLSLLQGLEKSSERMWKGIPETDPEPSPFALTQDVTQRREEIADNDAVDALQRNETVDLAGDPIPFEAVRQDEPAPVMVGLTPLPGEVDQQNVAVGLQITAEDSLYRRMVRTLELISDADKFHRRQRLLPRR